MIRGQISTCLVLIFLVACNEENNNSVAQAVDSQDVSHDTEVIDQDVGPAEPIVCRFDEDTQDCSTGCSGAKAVKEWIATIDEDGECAIEYTDNLFVFCYWWGDFIPPEERQWTYHYTVSYRYLENGEVEARALNSPMDAREGHGFINEWISCWDKTVQDHPPICTVCGSWINPPAFGD